MLKARDRSVSERFKAFDYIGWLFLGGGITLFLVGLTFGGNKFPWKSAQTLGPLIVGISLMVCSKFCPKNK